MINYDFPNNTEDYVHRIGRTARHDKTGTSYTFLTDGDAGQVKGLIEVMKESKQTIAPELFEMMERSKMYGGGKNRKTMYTGE